MIKRAYTRISVAVLAVLVPVSVLLVACGDTDTDEALSREDVEGIVRSELANVPAPVYSGPSLEEIEGMVGLAVARISKDNLGITRAEVEQIVWEAMAKPEPVVTGQKTSTASAYIPSKYDPVEYTKFFVKDAISRYMSGGLGAIADYYNREESVDGQWYVFILDQNDTYIAHAANLGLVGLTASDAIGPNGYPAGEAAVATADEDGQWLDYVFTNPATGRMETKHSWVVRYDGLTFGSGWYEPGPRKSDAPAYTKVLVEQAMNLYDALGLDAAVDYYSSKESVDGQWYVFMVDETGFTVAHHNPMFLRRDPSMRVDTTGYFYGDDLLGANEAGRWVDYAILNPETGKDQQKHTWAVRHDGLIFASGWYE